MRLLWSSRSPFARKVMVAAHELAIVDRIACERATVATDRIDPAVLAANPLNQIPTLLLDDGTALFDSAVIVAYLDAQAGGRLTPTGDTERWRARRFEAVGDGLSQINRGRLAEGRRGAEASDEYLAAFAAKTHATLDWLEREAETLARLDAGGIAVAMALAHLDFRFPNEGWRNGRERLAGWFERFASRPAMRATEFVDA